MGIEKHKIISLLFVLLVSSCSANAPSSGAAVNSTPPVIQISPLSQEKRIVGTDKVPQNNCNGTALLKQTLEKTRSIQYSLSAEAGLTVSSDGSIGVPEIGNVSVGASVAAKYGVEYGKVEELKRTIEYSAKEGTSVAHTINMIEILETGEFIVTVGSKTVKYPYKFLKDFALEYVGAVQETCPLNVSSAAQTVVTTVVKETVQPVIQTVVVEKTVVVEVTSTREQPVAAVTLSESDNSITSFVLDLQKYAVGDPWNEHGEGFAVSERAGSKFLLATSPNSSLGLDNLNLKDHFQVDVDVDLQFSNVDILLYDAQGVSLGFRLIGQTVSFAETSKSVFDGSFTWVNAGATVKNINKVRIEVEGKKAVLFVNNTVFGRTNVNGDAVYKRLMINGLQANNKNGVFAIQVKSL